MRSSPKQQRIEEIASQIAELSNELNRLLLEHSDPNDNNSSIASTRDNRAPADFSVGDRIVITNNYRGFRGHTGTVTLIGRNDYIHFRQDSPSIITKRKRYNIRRID